MKRITLARVNLRSFLIQLLFDPQRMQGMGFLFSMLPLLRWLYKGENLARACRRHVEYFNTNPYMSAVVLGAVSRLEESDAPDRTKQAKKLLAPPLAAMGDDFFWAVLRPLLAMIGMILVIYEYYIWGVMLFLILYNVPHLFVRTFGFRFAYKHSVEELVGILNRLKPNKLTFRFRLIGATVLGGFSGTLIMKGYFLPVYGVIEILGSASLMVLFSYGLARFTSRRVSPPTWALLIIVVCILMAGLVEIW